MNVILYIVVLFMVCLYLGVRYLFKNYDFYQPLHNKTVIMTWTHKCIGIENGDWGLGDIVKGTYAMYELSKRMGFELIVDISQHNVSKFLVQRPHKYQDFVLEHKDKIPYHNIVFMELEKQIRQDLMSKDVTILFCSGFLEPFSNTPNPYSISDEAKVFLKHILTPNQDLQGILNEHTQKLPFKEYSILHYRLGDEYAFNCEWCVKGNIPLDQYPTKIQDLMGHVKKHKEGKNIILLSDSSDFKKHVKHVYNDLFIFDLPITHVRYSQNVEETKNTLIEFFVMANAKSIHSFTVYKWISGFVLIANKVFDVPLTWEKDDS